VTFAPQTLIAVASLWESHGGVNLGIVGDTEHAAKGYSYHLGSDQLSPDAYSIRTTRDRNGLSHAASAIDLGRVNGSLTGLRAFSRWLVAQAQADMPGTSDIREIIYSPDGQTVLRWDRERGASSTPRAGEADSSHLTHTHISWYRDSEFRDRTTAITPYWEADVTPAKIVSQVPRMVSANAGHTWRDLDGTTIVAHNRPALAPRLSPYGIANGLRAIYTTMEGHPIVLIDPATNAPLTADCAQAVEDERQRIKAAVAAL
jgi:hypothetical protein